MTIAKQIICLMGFKQQPTHTSGIYNIYRKLSYDYDNVFIYPWNCPPKNFTNAMLIGYSYGAYTATLLINRSPTPIPLACLIDPVWRRYERRPSPLSIINNHKIYLRANVNKVFVWRQDRGVIKGHKIITDANITEKYIDTNHINIDDCIYIQNEIVYLAREYMNVE